MFEYMFCDMFTGKYVTKKDPYAQQGRYLPIGCGPQGVYIDKWEDEYGRVLNVAYTADEYFTEKHDVKRQCICAKYDFHPQKLKIVMIPEERFFACLKTYGTDEDVAAFIAKEKQRFMEEQTLGSSGR